MASRITFAVWRFRIEQCKGQSQLFQLIMGEGLRDKYALPNVVGMATGFQLIISWESLPQPDILDCNTFVYDSEFHGSYK